LLEENARLQLRNPRVSNDYPWPQEVTAKQRSAVETAAQAVLDARAQYPTSTLADLYDPLTMPAPLLQAHQDLDRAVDAVTGPSRSPATGTGWNTSLPSTKSSPPRLSPPPNRPGRGGRRRRP